MNTFFLKLVRWWMIAAVVATFGAVVSAVFVNMAGQWLH
jgi:hypothetical protein